MNDSRRGFTLIEVILAIVVFAVASGILIESVFAINSGLDQFASQETVETDIQFVRRTILGINNRDEMEDGGDIDTLNSGKASWEAEVEEQGVIDLFKLSLSISMDDEEGGNEEPHEYELYILRTGWSEAIERDTLLSDKREAIESKRNDFR